MASLERYLHQLAGSWRTPEFELEPAHRLVTSEADGSDRSHSQTLRHAGKMAYFQAQTRHTVGSLRLSTLSLRFNR